MRLPDFFPALLLAFLAAAGAPAAEQAAAAKQLSDYFPADTLVYLEIPSIPQLREGAKGTGLYALWHDDSMERIRTFLENLPAAEPGRTGGLETFKAVCDFAESITGGAAFGLVPGAGRPEHLFVIQVGADTTKAAAMLESIYASETAEGAPPAKVEISGIEATVSGTDGEHSCIAGGVLFIGSKYAFTGAIDRRAAMTNAGSLSATVNFTRASSFFSTEGAAYRAVVDFPAVYSKAKDAAAAFLPFNAEAIFEIVGGDDIETVSAEGTFRLRGVVDHIYISTRSADSKLIDMVGRLPFDESRLTLVPKDALFFGGRSSDPKGAYESSLELMQLVGPVAGIDFAAVTERLESAAGVSIERDILPALGMMSVGYFTLPEGMTLMGIASGAGFEQATLMEVADEEALGEALEKIANYVQTDSEILSMMAPSLQGPAKLETTTLGHLKIYTLSAAGAQFQSPSAALANGYFIYANTKDAVIAAVDRLIAPSASVLDNPDFTRARAALAKDICQLTYFNLDRAVDMLYENLLPMAAQQIDAAYNEGRIGFSSSEIPPAFRVKRHVDGLAMAVATAGNLVDIQIYSPFGLASAALPAIMAATTPAVREKLAGAPEGAEAGASPERQRLEEIGAMLQLATVERHGRFPEKLTDVIPAAKLQAPQDAEPDSPVDYEYVAGLTAYAPGKTIIVYEREGLQGDGRHVLYVDGSVEFLMEDDFQKAISGMQSTPQPKKAPAEQEGQDKAPETTESDVE